MSRAMRCVGYGSLTSAYGLGSQLASVADAWLVWVGARRGFSKPSQRGGRLAMDVAMSTSVVSAERLDSESAAGACERRDPGFVGLLLSIDPRATGALARREGYPEVCWERLVAAAGDPARVPDHLLRIAEQHSDPVSYRRALWELTGPSPLPICHYLPHPVRLESGPAIVFVAPDPGATGDPELPSVRTEHPRLRSMVLDTVFDEAPHTFDVFDAELQVDYAVMCLLAGAHGAYLGDLLGSGLGPSNPVRDRLAEWRANPESWRRERAALEAIPGLESGEYTRRFAPDLRQAGVWSGLEA